MKKDFSEKISRYCNKSKEAALEMEILFSKKYFSGAVDRAYYSVFHMAQALLVAVELEFSSHEAVISAFGREFAKTKKLDPKYHRTLMSAFDLRLTADYDVEVSVEEEEAQNLIEECRQFLKVVNVYLNSLLSQR